MDISTSQQMTLETFTELPMKPMSSHPAHHFLKFVDHVAHNFNSDFPGVIDKILSKLFYLPMEGFGEVGKTDDQFGRNFTFVLEYRMSEIIAS